MTKEEDLLTRSLVIMRECGYDYYTLMFGEFKPSYMYWENGNTLCYDHALFGSINEVACSHPYPPSPDGVPKNPIWIQLTSAIEDGKLIDRKKLITKLERKISRVLKALKK